MGGAGWGRVWCGQLDGACMKVGDPGSGCDDGVGLTARHVACSADTSRYHTLVGKSHALAGKYQVRGETGKNGGKLQGGIGDIFLHILKSIGGI